MNTCNFIHSLNNSTPDVNKLHTSSPASTHTCNNCSKSPGSSQPRRGVNSWPAIRHSPRSLKFHPFQPSRLLLPADTPATFLSPKHSLLSSHMQTQQSVHVCKSLSVNTHQPRWAEWNKRAG